MHMALADAGGGDFNEFRLLLHFVNRGAAAIAHAGTHATRHLVNDGDDRTLVRHPAFNAFWHQFVGVRIVGIGLLKIAVGTALLHGAQTAHAAIGLVAAPLIQDYLARRFFGAGKHAAHHHGAGTGGKCFGNIAAETNAAVGNQRNAAAPECGRDTVNRHDLRHADTGHDAGGAN